MRLAILLFITTPYCVAQDYNAKLSARLKEIKALSYYDNERVLTADTLRQGFPGWVSTEEYYEEDMVTVKGVSYKAIMDNKDKKPADSTNEWELSEGTYHPYQFLRDTAKFEDLKKLLSDKHPYVKCYAFGALTRRKAEGLFPVILDNLKDKTKIEQMTGDVGYDVYPADLMIWYAIDDLTIDEKNRLKKLIQTKYKHIDKTPMPLLGR